MFHSNGDRMVSHKNMKIFYDWINSDSKNNHCLNMSNGYTVYFPCGLKIRSYKFQRYWHITQNTGNNFKYIYDITDLSMNLSSMCIYKLLDNYYEIILCIAIWALLDSEEGWTESEI